MKRDVGKLRAYWDIGVLTAKGRAASRTLEAPNRFKQNRSDGRPAIKMRVSVFHADLTG
jgi:hypothetical protein